MIFPDPLPFRNYNGCVGLQDKGSISVVHVICIVLCGIEREEVEKKLE